MFSLILSLISGTDLVSVALFGDKSFSFEQSLLRSRFPTFPFHSSSFPLASFLMNRNERFGWVGRADIVITTPGRLLDHIDSTEGFTLQVCLSISPSLSFVST